MPVCKSMRLPVVLGSIKVGTVITRIALISVLHTALSFLFFVSVLVTFVILLSNQVALLLDKHSAESIFLDTNGDCAYVNEWKYGLLKHQAMGKYSAVRDAEKRGKSSA